ncbi:MAG: PilZ domain-containing protein [Lachnospiraceae bacterium]|nr:PilZ domain-containing protein [Lachnospiraceae bacterium]
MAIRCLMLDEKNRIIDYADLNYPPGGGAQLIPCSADTTNSFERGDIVKFQFEQRFDKVFDGVVVSNRNNKLMLDSVRHISNILQEDLRIEVFKDAVITYRVDKESQEEDKNKSEDENEDETVGETETEENKDEEYSFDIIVKDISSGGIGFYSKQNLPMDKFYEYVADWGSTPVFTKIKLLRKEKLNSDTFSYGGKFVDLYADEERVLRGGVFAIQARRCQDRRRKEDDIF